MGDSNAEKVEGQGPRMTLTRKLMLSAEFLGMEAMVNFQQIYTIPALQILGMPVSLSYIIGLISGPTAILFLPLLGWLVDKGSYPNKRKFASIVMASGLQVLGVLFVLWANSLHFSYLLSYQASDSSTGIGNSSNHSNYIPFYVNAMDSTNKIRTNVTSWWDGSTGNVSPAGNFDDGDLSATDDLVPIESYSIPFKAGVGMAGFVLLDLGFDATNSFVKIFMITCSPRDQHTSLLVLAVVMGSIGGVFNSLMGLVDFTSLFGLSYIEGGGVTVQTSVQGIINVVIIITGLLFTFCTGRKLIKETQNNSHVAASTSTKPRENGSPTVNERQHSDRNENGTPFIKSSGSYYAENGDSSFQENNVSYYTEDDSVSFDKLGASTELTFDGDYSSPFGGEKAPLLRSALHDEHEEEQDSRLGNYGNGDSSRKPPEERSITGNGGSDAERDEERRNGCSSVPCLQNPKVRIFFVCLTTLFSADAILLFTAALSDFLGKGVYGGDPSAEPGSESLAGYEEGVRMASWALLVYFISYLVSSIVHPAVLPRLGFRVEFILLQTLFSVTILIVALTSRLEAVFVLSVIAGMHRTCFYTMPYAVVNDIAQTIPKPTSGNSPVALSMSLVAASLPLSYCLLFSWVGVVEELTGEVSAPLLMSCAVGLMGVLVFMFVGKV